MSGLTSAGRWPPQENIWGTTGIFQIGWGKKVPWEEMLGREQLKSWASSWFPESCVDWLGWCIVLGSQATKTAWPGGSRNNQWLPWDAWAGLQWLERGDSQVYILCGHLDSEVGWPCGVVYRTNEKWWSLEGRPKQWAEQETIKWPGWQRWVRKSGPGWLIWRQGWDGVWGARCLLRTKLHGRQEEARDMGRGRNGPLWSHTYPSLVGSPLRVPLGPGGLSFLLPSSLPQLPQE